MRSRAKARAAVSITACVLRGVATPIVSAMSISSQPRSHMRPTTSATASSGTSPWYGQPNAQLMLPRRRRPLSFAAFATGSKRAMDSAIEQLMFRCENASDAEPKITTSSAFAASAASKPCMFGVSAEYSVPGRRSMPAMTSVLVAICGTHFGETNDAASMLVKPARDRRSTSSILTAADTASFSFCSPSRGPTSTILTCFGSWLCMVVS